jgi:hypothetical protein
VADAQGDNKVDDAWEAPPKNHLRILAHVNPAINGPFLARGFKGKVMGEPVFPFSGPVGFQGELVGKTTGLD